MNIAFVTNSPAPYRIKQINKFCEIEGINIRVYYTHKDGRRDWQLEEPCKAQEINLQGVKLFSYSGFEVRLNIGLVKIVRENDLILIGGYEQLAYLMLSILCRIYGKNCILIFDGVQPQKIGAKTSLIKHTVIGIIAKNARALFANGTVSRQYFMRNFQISESKIYNQYLTSDIDEIIRMSRHKNEIGLQVKKNYAISEDKFVIICVSRLIPLKNVQLLIRAASLVERKESCVLLLVGDGSERRALEALAEKLKVRTIFAGNIGQVCEVHRHLMAADLFAFPTTGEAWGLAINEAMAAGLPIVCSFGAGASMDLVKDGINGYIFPINDVLGLSSRINLFMDDKERCKRFGEASRAIISDWTYDRSKKAFYEMLKKEKLLE